MWMNVFVEKPLLSEPREASDGQMRMRRMMVTTLCSVSIIRPECALLFSHTL